MAISLPISTLAFIRAHVSDDNGCEDSTDVTIIDTAGVSLKVTKKGVTCNGGSDGQIHTVVSGGTAPYTLTIKLGTLDIPLTDTMSLKTGIYTVKVVDVNGTFDQHNINVDEPTAITPTYIVTNASSAVAADGSIAVTSTGGTGPYTVTRDGSDLQTLPFTYTALTANLYVLKVTDSKGCASKDSTVEVYDNSKVDFRPTWTDISCFGTTTGSITLTVLSGIPLYSAYINKAGGFKDSVKNEF